jgi:hypothetical protein
MSFCFSVIQLDEEVSYALFEPNMGSYFPNLK